MKKLTVIPWIAFVLIVVSLSYFLEKNFFSDYFYGKGNETYSSQFNLTEAEKWYQWSLRLNSKQPYAHYQLARISLVKGDYNNGLSEINEELALHPENKRSYYVKGLLDGYGKNYEQAEDDFKNFIDYTPDEWAGYMDLSWVYINSGKFQEAIDITNKALNKFPQNPWLYSNNGLALYKSGKYEEAKVSLEKAKDLAKNLTADDWRKAYPGNNAQEADKGVKEIKAAIAYNLSLVYRNLGEIDKYLDEQNEYMNLSR